MARPNKKTVDYFPHDCNHKKTMFILENKFGNDGYAFWFKLLEILGSTENHVFDTENPADWEFLLAKTRVNEVTATEILKTLANLDAIDPELWAEGIIWCQNFVDRISDVYTKREGYCPQKPSFRHRKHGRSGVSDTGNTQTKLKETRQKKTIYSCPFFQTFWTLYPRKEGKGKAWDEWEKIKPKPNDNMMLMVKENITIMKNSNQWKRDNGKYIPLPATWLHQRRWEDEPNDNQKGNKGSLGFLFEDDPEE